MLDLTTLDAALPGSARFGRLEFEHQPDPAALEAFEL